MENEIDYVSMESFDEIHSYQKDFRIDLVRLCSGFFTFSDQEKYEKLQTLLAFEKQKEFFNMLTIKLSQKLNLYNDEQFAKLDTMVFYIRGFFQATDAIIEANGGISFINERLTNKHFGIIDTENKCTENLEGSQVQGTDDFWQDPLANPTKSDLTFMNVTKFVEDKNLKSIPTIKNINNIIEDKQSESQQLDPSDIEFVTPLEYIEHFCSLNQDENIITPVPNSRFDKTITPREMETMACTTPKHEFTSVLHTDNSFVLGNANNYKSQTLSNTTPGIGVISPRGSPFIVNPDKVLISDRQYPQTDSNLLQIPNLFANHQMHCYEDTVKSCTSYESRSQYIEKDSNFKSQRTIEVSPSRYFETFNQDGDKTTRGRNNTSKVSVNNKLMDIKFENFPRDNTDLRQESSMRHLKSLGAFLGSTLGFMVFGVGGCLAGGTCGLIGGREAIKIYKKKNESSTENSKNEFKESNTDKVNNSHSLGIKKSASEKRFGEKPINLDILTKK